MRPLKITHLVFIAFVLHFSSFAQVQNDTYRGDENYLRMSIEWNDSTEYQIPGYTTATSRSIYKFRVKHCSWGIYQEREIYIAASEHSIASKFNPNRELKKIYFWTLRKSEYEVNGLPLYIHSGNF